MLAEKAKDKRFLNLFSYTSVASVQAILGGAASSTSVDMSQTYINWSEKNYKSNGIDVKKHLLVRANVIDWLAANSEKFDLIFLDPPSFSNSKRMEGTLDIQRDQQQLVTATMQSLAVDGELIFSNNRKGFKLDQALLDAYSIEDISRKSIDVDFERNTKIHQCWSIKHRA
jgi:23S rRNA (guanine2445-N2)-methyltransferase / 23S rRNA (guanine2069-N7)-methyltransferase